MSAREQLCYLRAIRDFNPTLTIDKAFKCLTDRIEAMNEIYKKDGWVNSSNSIKDWDERS